MKTLLTLLILLSTIMVCKSQQEKNIEFFSSSWSETLNRARKESKPIFLYTYTSSCRFCRQMEKEVFSNKEVSDFYNSNFISHKIDIEDGAEGEALAGKYAIVGFPTYLYFDKNGMQVHQSGSAKPAEEFIFDGKNALNPETSLFTLKRQYDNGDRSPDLLYNYSVALTSYHHKDSPEEKVVKEYLETQSTQQLESTKNIKYIFTRHLSFNSPATQYFLKNQNKFIPSFEDNAVERKAEKIITRTSSIAGRNSDIQLLDQIEKSISANLKDKSRLTTLARIYYHQGQRNWSKYAAATLEYSRGQGKDDMQTMYETAIYLKHFAKDTQTLELGVQIMEKVIKLEESYKNLNLYAQFQHTVGKDKQALKTAREAIEVAKKSGEESSEANELVVKLQIADEK